MHFSQYSWIFHMFHSLTSCFSEGAQAISNTRTFLPISTIQQQNSSKDRCHFSKRSTIFLSFPSFSRTRKPWARKIRRDTFSFNRTAATLIHFYFYACPFFYRIVDNSLLLIKERIPHRTFRKVLAAFSTVIILFSLIKRENVVGKTRRVKRGREKERKREREKKSPAFFFFYRDVPPRFARKGGSGTI